MATLVSAKAGNFNDVDAWHPCPNVLLTISDNASYEFNANGGTFAFTPVSGFDMLGAWVEAWYNQAPVSGMVLTCYLQENTGSWVNRASGTYTITDEGYGAGIYFEFSSAYPVTAAAVWRLAFTSSAGTYYLGVTQTTDNYLRYAMVAAHYQTPATGDTLLIAHAVDINDDFSAVNINHLRIGRLGAIDFATNANSYLQALGAASYSMGGDIILGQEGSPVASGYTATLDIAGLTHRSYSTSRIIAEGEKRWTSFKSKLATAAGGTSSVLDDDTNWLVGEEILFCPTGDVGASSASPTEDYETLTSVSGYTIGHTAISYGHYAAGDFKGTVVNLTRNTRIIRSSGGVCNIATSYGRWSHIDLYCCELKLAAFTAEVSYTVNFEEVSIKAGDQNLYVSQTWSGDAITYTKNCVFCNFLLGYFGGYHWTSDTVIYADGSTTSDPGAYFLFYYHSIFTHCVVAGIYRNTRLYFNGCDDFSDNEFIVCDSYSASYPSFQLFGYVGVEAVNCKWWKNNYHLFYFDANTNTGIMTFDNCKFAGNGATGYADFFNSLASTYNGMIIFKNNCDFEGWTGRTCAHAFYGSFGNLLIGSGTKFGYTTPYTDRYFRFLIGSKVNMHDIWASNLAIYNDGLNLGIEDYVAIQGANGDPNYIICYSNYGSKITRDYEVYYGESGHSIKLTPAVGYHKLAFALLRFWIPCTANEKVTVQFRCRKSAPIFYAGVYTDTVNPTVTLRSLDEFDDVVTTMDAADTNWNLITVEGTPTRDGSLILDIWHADYNGRPINIDAFEVTYG